MPIEALPEKLIVPTSDELVRRYVRDYKLRSPGADVGENSLPLADAKLIAATVMPLYAEAERQAAVVDEDNMNDAQAETEAARIGLSPIRIGEIGASGFVEISASVGGGTIFAGDELKEANTGYRFECAATKLYADEELVPVVAVDVGVGTNLDPGTVLTWTSPRPGIGQKATVHEEFDGSGLSGGRAKETLAELVDRIRRKKRNPAASGNAAEYIEVVEATTGVSIQKAFAIPCVNGPASIAILFTVKPSKAGGSRVPNAAQIARVQQQLAGHFPADDSWTVCTLTPEDIALVLAISWTKAGSGWEDANPWPPSLAATPVTVSGFALANGFTTVVDSEVFEAPVPGQTIALYNAATNAFVRKRILSVSTSRFVSTSQFVLAFDMTNNLSDPDFAPASGAILSPWSDQLDSLVPSVLAYFDGVGPGEQIASFDDGQRQRRQPESPEEWSSEVTTRAIEKILPMQAVKTVEILAPDVPFATPLGTAMSFSRIFLLTDFAVVPG